MNSNKRILTAFFIVLGIFILTGVIIGIFYATGTLNKAISSSSFTPVYCNQYEFTCCNEILDYSQSFSLSNIDALKCPETATRCKISGVLPSGGLSDSKFVYGHGNCVYQGWLIFKSWKCDIQSETSSTSFDIKPGDYIWTKTGSTTITNKVYKNQLIFCGRAGCTTGVPISSSNCVLTESQGTIFTTNGQNVGLSYTVPSGSCVLSWHSGDRTICGNLEEQCDSDSDCSGHTYGNKECTGRTLQTYGCNNLGLPSGVTQSGNQLIGKEIIPGISNPSYSGATSRCEIVSSSQVQCCGDTDCGSNFFCDKTSFTCKENVECTKNYDCGVSEQCDYSENKLKTPICSSGKCTYKEESVDCCLDTNCPTGYTCSNNKCEQKSIVKINCPNQCCIGLDAYIDKPCINGEFCINNACTSSGCKSNSDCPGQVCKAGNCIDKEQLTCSWYESYYEKTEKQCRIIGLFWCQDVPISGCQTAGWLYLIVISFIIILVAGIIVGIFYIRKKLR